MSLIDSSELSPAVHLNNAVPDVSTYEKFLINNPQSYYNHTPTETADLLRTTAETDIKHKTIKSSYFLKSWLMSQCSTFTHHEIVLVIMFAALLIHIELTYHGSTGAMNN